MQCRRGKRNKMKVAKALLLILASSFFLVPAQAAENPTLSRVENEIKSSGYVPTGTIFRLRVKSTKKVKPKALKIAILNEDAVPVKTKEDKALWTILDSPQQEQATLLSTQKVKIQIGKYQNASKIFKEGFKDDWSVESEPMRDGDVYTITYKEPISGLPAGQEKAEVIVDVKIIHPTF